MLPVNRQFEAALQIIAELRAAGTRLIWRADACATCFLP